MKKLIIAFLVLCSCPVFAAQRAIAPVAVPNKLGDLRASVNASLAAAQSNFVELYASQGGAWMPTSGPTAANQIIQATGSGASAWTSIVQGLINDAGTGTDDLWSASKTISSMTAKLAAPGPIGGTTPGAGTFTSIVATSFDFGAPATGQTGEIGLQEDPANGNNIVTLKAPAALAADLVITLPTGVVPSTASTNCTAGQWWYDTSYWYVCVAANTWKRTALATW